MNTPSSAIVQGQCLCGAVRVQLAAVPAVMTRCHCGQCRKASGAGWLGVVPVAQSACTIEDTHGWLREYRATPDKARFFCGRCGAPIYSRRDGATNLRLRAGLFDDLPGLDACIHIFVAHAAGWDRIDDESPRYPGLEPGRVI